MTTYISFLVFSMLIISLIACNKTKEQGSMPILRTNDLALKLTASNGIEEKIEIPFSKEKSDTAISNFYLDSISFNLSTDLDKYSFTLKKGEQLFVVLEADSMMPMYILFKNSIDVTPIHFDSINHTDGLKVHYQIDANAPYLVKLRNKYPMIDSLSQISKTDLERVKNISTWVNSLWEHNGYNEPQKRDAISILEEVEKGEQFRCVEYGVVTAACLKALGLPARTLGLKTADVETRESGAGHVLLEVYINDLEKWIMVDPQFNAIPMSNDTPLNAVELQYAITENKSLSYWSSGDNDLSSYSVWIYPYLYHFDIKIDNRENISQNDYIKFREKSSLMLIPLGVKEPTIFQGMHPINYCAYTNSVKDFYAKPN